MAEIRAGAKGAAQRLDVCRLCQFVWFDAGEYAALPTIQRVERREEPLPAEAREKLALLKIRAIREKMDEADWGGEFPDCGWQWIAGLLGMPVESNPPGVWSRPWVTWLLAALIILAGAV